MIFSFFLLTFAISTSYSIFLDIKMAKRKLQRFADNLNDPYILDRNKPLFEQIKGRWNEAFFQNPYPITLELACGAGEYTVGLAQKFPERNFVGIDLKGDRLWKGARNAEALGLKNVAFLRIQIQHLTNFFAQNEVSEIWIVFPDPQPRAKKEKLRLTNPRFLELYKQVIQNQAFIKLKTDNTQLFEYTLEVLKEQKIEHWEGTNHLYESSFLGEHFGIQTKYEKMFMAKGLNIKYLKFKIC